MLRGVNVGGVRLAMADLRAAVESCGHADVVTYVQSGNVVFSADGRFDADVVARQVRAAVLERAGIDPQVVVLTAGEWDGVVAANPYPDESDGTKLHAVIARQPYTAAQREAAQAVLDAVRETGSSDELMIVGRVLYLHLPGGMGRSKLAEKIGRNKAAGQHEATARNWRTVLALQERL